MNFTREPIIETVITPKEGCKLVVRNSKGVSQEDYYVDAVEVVSFGHSFFYRSMERPKSFLLPVSDYELVELKETRMVLKNVGVERSIKIGGTKDILPKPQEIPQEKVEAKKRRTRRRKAAGEPQQVPSSKEKPQGKAETKPDEALSEEEVSSSISRLLPPPPVLIKEKLTRYKDNEILEANLIQEEKREKDLSPSKKTPEESSYRSEMLEKKKPFMKEEEIPEIAAKREPQDEPLDEPAHKPEEFEEENSEVIKKEQEEK